MTGVFRLKAGGTYWPYEAWQYDHGPAISRLCHMRVDYAGVVPVLGRAAYVNRQGTMDGRVLGLLSVVSGHGLEYDISELTTFLNDALIWCPGLLAGLHTSWTDLEQNQFEVRLRDHNLTVAGRVTIDHTGHPILFTTRDRYVELDGSLARTEWHTPVTGWVTVDDHPVPTEWQAIWQLPTGPFRYADLDLDVASVQFNCDPGGCHHTRRTTGGQSDVDQTSTPRIGDGDRRLER